MLRGIVIGNVVSTRKQDALIGSKFMEVQLMEKGEKIEKYIIAVDSVGAGIGEEVLVTTGSSARLALAHPNVPTDAVIVGIIDPQ
jgi:ethanolamine utilization protein EutN